MSCLCACFEGIVSMVQSVHVTSWNYSFPAHSTTHLIGKHMCKYSSENNIKQSNLWCAETWPARHQLHKLRARQTNWHRIVLVSSTMLVLLCWCSTYLYIVALSFGHLFVVFLFLLSCNKQYAHRIAQNPIPAWKNMPMMAIIASLPLAISALSFLVFSAGSEAVNTLNPKSPAYASVPGVCSWETSQKAA